MTYAQADYLRIPLLDGGYGVAQIFEIDATRPGSLFCGISTRRTTADAPIAPFPLSEVVAMAFTQDTLVTSGQWIIGGFDQIPRFRAVMDYDQSALSGFPDHPVHDPAVIEAFVNAVHGLYPWDSFGDLFERIKRHDIARPASARS